MLYTSLFVWEMSVIGFDDRIYDVIFDGFGERVIFRWLDCGKCLILLRKMGICKEIFWIFYEDFLRKFCDFWSSSIEALFYKGWEVFWRYFWWFLVMLKWRKTLIFQGFVELGIELKMGVEAWGDQICHSWQSNICSKM